MTTLGTPIENTFQARTPPPRMYRLLRTVWAGEDSGLYHVRDFARAELALRAAEAIDRKGRGAFGAGIVHDGTGRVLTLDDGPSHMYTRERLLRVFGGAKRPADKRAFTPADADKIEALQPERLPGWVPGDRMLVFWEDIAEATGAEVSGINFAI